MIVGDKIAFDSVRENSLVTVTNVAGYLDLSLLAGDVSRRLLLDGLLHWLVCRPR